jgi:hypothetical protein
MNKLSIKIKFGQLVHVLSWCENNCINVWYFNETSLHSKIADGFTEYEFQFDKEEDAVLFTLRWL